jgi:two-component system response regulator MprA
LANELHRQGEMSDSLPSPRLVLLVDDDLRTARRMADMLREDGFAVEVARDGAAAIARLARAPVPDAVVTELNVGHVDGATVGQFARTRRAGMPIVVVTGYPDLFRAAAFGAEPPLVFTKPVDYLTLRDALASQLRLVPDPRVPHGDLSPPLDDLQLESAPTDASGDAISGAEAVRALQRA